MRLPPSALASTLSSTFKRDVLAHFTPTLILQSTFLQYVIEAEYSILEKVVSLDLDLMKGAYVFHLSLLLKYYLKVLKCTEMAVNSVCM
ncbi:unnamed protein product [Lactuca virosa]|uniref:Uncharacterized protein n=1 Tax=Lactuca virosa TaxID=75947 RepID=A0AAU9MKR8_9ASTR|nr:unnamed protein product [Lactuca virosa]